MARPRERIDVDVLAPAEWVIGWLKSFLVIAAVIGVVLGVVSGHSAFSWRVLLAVTALVVLLPLYLWPARVSLLEDGVAIKRYGLTRFVAYSAIARTEMIQRLGASEREEGRPAAGHAPRRRWNVYTALRIHLRSGRKIDIVTSSEEQEIIDTGENMSTGATGRFGTFDRKAWQLGRDIGDRVRDVGTAPPTAALALSLLRGEQSVEEWRAAIDAAAPAGDVYRGGDGAQEALWRLVEDEDAPREARAGAALALRRTLDDDGRARVRVVIEGCESPKLRVALEIAADAEANDERLSEALREASLPRDE